MPNYSIRRDSSISGITDIRFISSTAATPTFSSVTVSNKFFGDGSELTGIPTVSDINTHTGDTTIHFTKGSINLSDLSSSGHTHPISEVVNLQSTLNTKALQSDLVTHTGDTSIHYTKESLNSIFVNKSGDTITGNLTVNGNLSVLGTATTINTTELTIEDNIITINSTLTAGTPTVDAGIYSLRGSATAAAFIWSETNDYWEAGLSGSTTRMILEGDNLSLLVSGHTHPIGEISGLQVTLDSKIESSLFNNYTGNTKALQSDLSSHTGDTNIHYTKNSINLSDLSSSAHTHLINDIVNLQSNLNGKLEVTIFNNHTGNTSEHSYTSGTTLVGSTLYFNRTDLLSAYTADLSSFNNNDIFVSGGTFDNIAETITLTRNDNYEINITGLTETYIGSREPNETDDISKSFGKGQKWLFNKRIWINLDNTIGNSIWEIIPIVEDIYIWTIIMGQ